MSANNTQQTIPDDTASRRRKLCQSIGTLPPNEASKGFETLLRSYDHGSSGSFTDMKDEGVFDLALDLMDPPPDKQYNVSPCETAQSKTAHLISVKAPNLVSLSLYDKDVHRVFVALRRTRCGPGGQNQTPDGGMY